MKPHYDAMQLWLKRRDPDAFRTLVLSHAGMVYGTCRRILGDATEAEDVAQECFLALATLDHAPTTNSIGAWLHGVATKRSLQRVRNETLRRQRETRAVQDTPQSVEPSWDDLIEHVDHAIAELPPALHAPLIEYFLEGKTQREVALSLNIPERTVSLRIAQAIDHVRGSLRKRAITVSIAALSSLCLQHAAEAAPAALIANLGKLALAGPSRTAATGSLVATTGVGTGLKFGAVMIAAALLLFAYYWQRPNRVDKTASAKPVASIQTANPELAPISLTKNPSEAPKETAPTPTEPPAEPGSVTGRVYTVDEQPVPNAEVILLIVIHEQRHDDYYRLNESYARRLRFLKAITDYNGRYLFDVVPFFGKGEVVAHAEGKLGQRTQVTVMPADETTVPTIFMRDAVGVYGVISDVNHAPLDSALVSVEYAWRTKGDSYLPMDRTTTDSVGRFKLWVDPETEWITLRAISPAIGQCYFPNLAVGSSPLTLREPATATLYGRVSAPNAGPFNIGTSVVVIGQLPSPELSVWYSGGVPMEIVEVPLDFSGNYRIKNLYPGLNYRAHVSKTDPVDDRRKIPLQVKHNFIVKEGESIEWSPEVSSPITFSGRVLTEISKTPAPRISVYVLKDGKILQHGNQSDVDGHYRVDATKGSGRYQIVAYHDGSLHDEIRDDHMRRFAKSYDLKGGETIEVDLPIYEPATLPLRIIDDIGNSVNSISYTVHITLPDGTDYSWGNSTQIGDDGNLPFKIYTPATDFWMEIKPFNLDIEKPFATPHFEITPGAILPEQTVVFDRPCGVKARVTNANGIPLRHTSLEFFARFDDGNEQLLQLATDTEGLISAESVLMPGTMEIHVQVGMLSDRELAPIELGTLEAHPGETIDFGDLVFTDAPAEDDDAEK